MKFLMRKFIGWLVGTWFVAVGRRRRCVRRYYNEGNVLSFYAHDPKPEVLEGVLKWLSKKGFTFVSTDELLDMRDGKAPWKKRCAWLTFDDGWAGFEEKLLPVLIKYNCPATIFVPPKETERGQVWTNSIMREVSDINPFYSLAMEERYAKVDEILARIGNPRRLSPEDELKRLAKHPLVTLENHTYSHLSCRMRPAEEVVAEVVKTQAILNDWTGRTPRLVCYPFGHYTSEVDKEMNALNLVPVHSVPGVMTTATTGEYRNMFHETMSTAENIGRILGAWVEVKVQ